MIKSKLPGVGTTIFTVMSSLAQQHNAINLGQGFPDFEMPGELTELVSAAMRSGHNQYTHMNGLPLLRTRLAEKYYKSYGTPVNEEEEITVTPGGTYAIYTALTAILQPGDEVILFEPAYDSYIPNIIINGAIPRPVKLMHPGYSIDWNEVRTMLNEKTRAIIINSPHNPTGTLLTKEDMLQLQEVTQGSRLIIISDEVYEHLVFDGLQHESVLKYPALRERSLACFSFGKVYHCTGWKTGYCIAPAELMKEFRKVHQFNCFTCNTPVQHGIAEFLLNGEHYLSLGEFLQAKRDFLQNELSGSKLKPLPSHGSYFQLYSYDSVSDLNEQEMAEKLTVEAGVATIPVSAFYSSPCDNKVLRLCFAKKEDTLKEAARRLKTI